jgi:hypothetical protein
VKCENRRNEENDGAQQDINVDTVSGVDVEFVEENPRDDREIYRVLLSCSLVTAA